MGMSGTIVPRWSRRSRSFRSSTAASKPPITGMVRSRIRRSGFRLESLVDGFSSVGRFAADLDIGARVQDGANAFAHGRMIVGNQYTNQRKLFLNVS